MDILNTKIKSILTEKNTKILPENIKSGVNILGVTGNVIALNGETKTITPTTSNQTILPSSGKNAITQVNVDAVTSAIDNNIQAANIKSGVTILEVTGTYEGQQPTGTIPITQNGIVDVSQYASADVNVPAQSDYNAKLSLQGMTTFGIAYAMRKIGNLDLTGITSCSSSFSGLGNLTELGELSNSSSVTNMGSMFYGCSSLTSLGTSTFGSNFSTANVTNGMSNMFQYCSGLTSLDLTNFNTRKVTYMTRMFQGCSNLETITFGSDFSLEKCTNASSLQQMFGACSKLDSTTLNTILGILATYAGTSNKTLQFIGLTSAQATTCTGLSNWSVASAAGWTTGY